MRKILSFVFFFAVAIINIFAQKNGTLEFTNPTINGTKYRITFTLKSDPNLSVWNVGSTNFRCNYPQTVLSNPVVAVENFPSTTHGATTTTGSNTSSGLLSINTSLNSGQTGVPVPSTGFDAVTMEFDIIDMNGLFNAANTLVWRVGTTFSQPRVAIVTDASTGTNGVATAVNITSSPSLAPLPIELLSFTGKAKDEVNTFRWDVASQANVSHFVVERSADGVKNFREVTERVKAEGTTNQLMVYTAEDKSPINLGYYRLKSVDFDGSTNYSNVITIDRRNTKFGVIDLSPNPTNDVVRINFESNTRGNIDFTVTDLTGRIVKTQSAFASVGNNNITIDMADLTVGTYFISMTDGKNTTVEKVVKQ